LGGRRQWGWWWGQKGKKKGAAAREEGRREGGQWGGGREADWEKREANQSIQRFLLWRGYIDLVPPQ